MLVRIFSTQRRPFCIFDQYFLISMKIIIAGGGEFGFHLAKLLSFESLDITLIDTDKERLTYAENHLDIKTLKGNACSLSIIKEAKVGTADLFIAVTSEETANITVCALAKQLGCQRTIARISTIEYIKENDCINFEMSIMGGHKR